MARESIRLSYNGNINRPTAEDFVYYSILVKNKRHEARVTRKEDVVRLSGLLTASINLSRAMENVPY